MANSRLSLKIKIKLLTTNWTFQALPSPIFQNRFRHLNLQSNLTICQTQKTNMRVFIRPTRNKQQNNDATQPPKRHHFSLHKMRPMLRKHSKQNPTHTPSRIRRTKYRNSNNPQNQRIRNTHTTKNTIHLRNEKKTKNRQMHLQQEPQMHNLRPKTTHLQILPLRTNN